MPIKFGQRRQLPEIKDRDKIVLKPIDGGMDVSVPAWHPSMLTPPVKSCFSINTMIRDGRVSKAPGLKWWGDVSASSEPNVLALAEFEKQDGTTYIMRIVSDRVEYNTGSGWVAITSPGLSCAKTNLPSTMTVDDLDVWVFANGIQVLKKWEGPGNNVVDFSASAPIANHIAFFDDRLVAADVVVGGTRYKERLIISDDSDITNFSSGNSDDVILNPDSSERPSPIMGLSALFTRFLVYRRHSIWEGRRTGYPPSPFRFEETVSDLGVLAPKSIARYDPLGDIFLGSDKQVYLFKGTGAPIPVGAPIQRDLQNTIGDFGKVYAKVDPDNHLYWLMAPTKAATDCDVAWIWDIDAWFIQGRLVWSKRQLPLECICLGFGDVPLDPGVYIDDETRYIDEISELIDDWQKQETVRLFLLGGESGWVWYQSAQVYTDDINGGGDSFVATHDLPQMGDSTRTIWLDNIYIEYRADLTSSIELSISDDGGTVFSDPIQFSLPAVSKASTVKAHVGRNVQDFIPRLRFNGDDRPEIIGIIFTYSDRAVSR